MKIFGKKSNVFVVVVVMAAFLAGCSNLWDYQPKNSNNKKPGNPTDQTPPPQQQTKPAKIQLPNGDTLDINIPEEGKPLEDILSGAGLTGAGGKLTDDNGNPYSDKMKNPDKPKLEGILVEYPDGSTKYYPIKDDGTLDTGGETVVIPPGSRIVPQVTTSDKDIKPFVFTYNDNGYEREIPVPMLTDTDTATWEQIKEAAEANGIELIPPSGYSFELTVDRTTSYTDESGIPPIRSGSDLSIKCEKNVTYKVDGQDVTVTLRYPEKEATWAQIKAAAEAAGITIDGKVWIDASGELVSNDSNDKTYPAGTTFTPSTILNYTITDINGVDRNVPIRVPAGDTTATWAQIKTAAEAQGINLGPTAPNGSELTGWKYGNTSYSSGSDATADTAIPNGNKIGPVFTAKYTISDGTTTYPATVENVTYPGATIKEIFTAATGLTTGTGNPGISGFNGWTVTKPNGEKIKNSDGTEKIFSESEINAINNSDTTKKIIPPGSTITPSAAPHKSLNLGGDDTLDMTGFEGGSIGLTDINGFYMADIELTRAQWLAVMDKNDNEGNPRDPKKTVRTQSGWLPTGWDTSTNTEYPMTHVSWFDAVAFCNWLSIDQGKVPFYYVEIDGTRETNPNKWGEYPTPSTAWNSTNGSGTNWYNIKMDSNGTGYRLPTMDEWLFAARGGKEILFPKFSGDTYNGQTTTYTGDMKTAVDRVASHNANGHSLRKASESGGDNPIRDMNGNVWEWCWKDKKNSNDIWPARGGGYNAGPTQCTIDYINDGNKPAACSLDTGFRIIEPILNNN